MSKRRRRLTAEDIPEVQERKMLETLIPDTEEVQKVDFGVEQDVRVNSHSNGWTPNLVESTVDANDPPKFPPDDDDSHHHNEKPEKGSQTFQYFVAGVYLAAGTLAFYVGIQMILDLRKES